MCNRYVGFLLTLILYFNAYAADFSTSTCTFSGDWDKISDSAYSTEIQFNNAMLRQLSAVVDTNSKEFEKYSETFNLFKIQDPFQRLIKVRQLWLQNTYKNKNEINGIVAIIDTVLKDSTTRIRSINCLEWGLFEQGAKLSGFDLSIPIYSETSWSVWQKESTLKIILEKGLTNTVKSDISQFKFLYANGWKQIFDIHNHPALQKHPQFSNLEDLGPNLFPSPEDTQYWASSLKYENKLAVITDGIFSLEVNSSQFEKIAKIYFCNKYPDHYVCKDFK